MNLLDLDNDVLNIIGDYVKKDNHERDFHKYLMEEVKKNSIKLFKIIKKQVLIKKIREIELLIIFMSIIFKILKQLIFI